MPPKRPKPPAETKAELMMQIGELLQKQYPVEPHKAIQYLLNYFTSVDLAGIKKDLTP